MRPLLALIIAVGILAGLQLYMQFRHRTTAPRLSSVEQRALGIFSVEVTLTFDAGPDPFAIDASNATALEVLFRGTSLLRETGSVPAGIPILIDAVSEIVEGRNEFFVTAIPVEANSNTSHALRVRIRRDGEPIADQTLWSEPGGPVQGIVTVNVPSRHGAPSPDHDHGTTESSSPGNAVIAGGSSENPDP